MSEPTPADDGAEGNAQVDAVLAEAAEPAAVDEVFELAAAGHPGALAAIEADNYQQAYAEPHPIVEEVAE